MFTTDPAQDHPDEPTGAAAVPADAVPLLDGPACPCGARTDRPHTECRKCRARGRWQRRTTGRARRSTGGRRVPPAQVADGS